MLCPRCEQGDIFKAKIIADDTCLFVCQECEASWFYTKILGLGPFSTTGLIWKA